MPQVLTFSENVDFLEFCQRIIVYLFIFSQSFFLYICILKIEVQVQVLEGQVQVSSTGLYSIFRMRGWLDRGLGASFGRPGATFNIKASLAP